ncbi:MAG: hypothetical protein JXR25_04275 [Pontiellaceae bacterium]|nr:hypothetical protein [Pontiellaceae bacterium]MBN2784020.1 hypothetical protein [Pontiellaceae bacterium]
MNRLEIMVRGGKNGFRPGEVVAGNVSWNLNKLPRKGIVVSLVWYTSGIGTRDEGVGASTEIACSMEQGSSSFSLTLPEGPFSFSGKLITLSWAVEAVAGKERAFANLVLSSDGEEVRL